MATTVNARQQQGDDDRLIERVVATRFFHACDVRPHAMRLRVEKSAIGVQGEQEEEPKSSQEPPKALSAQPGSFHCSHLAVRRTNAL
jgi:hypothetical protein